MREFSQRSFLLTVYLFIDYWIIIWYFQNIKCCLLCQVPPTMGLTVLVTCLRTATRRTRHPAPLPGFPPPEGTTPGVVGAGAGPLVQTQHSDAGLDSKMWVQQCTEELDESFTIEIHELWNESATGSFRQELKTCNFSFLLIASDLMGFPTLWRSYIYNVADQLQ